MKQYNKIFIGACIVALILSIGSCDKKLDELAPHNVSFEAQQFSTPAGFTKATVANYAALGTTYTGLDFSKNFDVIWLNLAEFRGNNVRFIDVASTVVPTASREADAFTFSNSQDKDYGYSYWFWRGAYQTLLSINTVLKHVNENETNPEILQSKGENLFLRAALYFDLVRLYGRPYYQSPGTNPGIQLILAPIIDINARPSRATVKATYDQIVKDLTDAIASMNQKKVNSYANKYAAYALLSRVYLYMGGTFTQPDNTFNQKAKQAADSVILNGGYTMLNSTSYVNYYKSDNQTNTETIWAINHTVNQNGQSMPLMVPPDNRYTGGWVRPSPDFLSLLAPSDLRKNYYPLNKYPGNTTDTLGVAKYALNYTAIYTNSPLHYLRLAEMYLNRAEALVKTGDNANALTDLNVIRVRAGLLPALGLTGQALFDEILKQRRIELAFEGHNSFDYFRNGLPMVRSYSSYNSGPLTVAATDPKVVLRIPQDEITQNSNLTQNEQ